MKAGQHKKARPKLVNLYVRVLYNMNNLVPICFSQWICMVFITWRIILLGMYIMCIMLLYKCLFC